MVERISGQSSRDYVKQTVLDPLGMDETDWYYEPEALDRFVKAYNAVDGELVPEVSNSAYAWGGLTETEYIIDPENNMIALFYLNMYQRESLYPEFLSRAYQLFEE